MDFNKILEQEENLDPKDWQSFKELAHQMLEDSLNYLQTVRERPVWQNIPAAIKENYTTTIPHEGESLNSIYQDFQTNILPYNKGNIHPSFWAWVQGTGTPTAVLADMWASTMNPNVAIGEHAAMYIDKQVIEWCKEMMGFPAQASGLLVSGGSMANFTGLTVGRNQFTELRNRGLKDFDKQLVIFCSTETHSCVLKSVETLGIGANNIVKIEVDEHYQISIPALKNAIEAEYLKGNAPFCIIANAGTVNTGAIDDLDAIAEICEEHLLWFHIDGAFGALAKLVPSYQNQLKGIEKANSIAFDLHKWMYLPYEIGCVLINDRAKHRAAFNLSPSYLLAHERGLAAGPDPLNNYGVELSRGFKALKAWFCIKEHGIDKFARLIEQNIAQAFYLGNLVEKHPNLELLTPVTMNIVCFRFIDSNLDDDKLNILNKEILMTLHEKGIAAPSNTILNGKYCIRVANVNHRSQKQDFDELVAQTVAIGLSKSLH